MKKLLSLFLAVMMVASIVMMMPVFTVSAASGEALTKLPTLSVLSTKTEIKVKNPTTTHFDGSIANLFDGNWGTSGQNSGSKWEGGLGDNTATITFETDGATTVAYYVLYTGNDSGLYKGRNPSSFRLYGSTDNEKFVLLDSVAVPGMENIHATPYAYQIDSPGAYKYYKMEFDGKTNNTDDATKASTQDGYFQLNELRLFSDVSNGTSGLTQDTTPGSITEGRYKIPATMGGNNGHGFIDMNFYIDDATYAVKGLLGTDDFNVAMEHVKLYVNGNEARINHSYKGYPHSGFNGGYNGFFFGIVGAGVAKGETATITALVGDDAYLEVTFIPDATTHAVADSKTEYLSDINTLYSTVTFYENPGLEVGSKLTLRVHDDHDERNAVVTAVDGNTVTIKVENFTSNETLCEFNLADGSWFALPIDVKGNSVNGFVQLRPNSAAPAESFDTRFVLETHESFIKDFTSVKLDITFNYGDNQSKTFTTTDTITFKSLIAGNEVLTAMQGFSYLGVVITGIPNAAYNVQITATLSGENGDVVKTFAKDGINNPFADPANQTVEAVQNSGYQKFYGIEQHEVGGPVLFVFNGSVDVYKLTKESGCTTILVIDDVIYFINPSTVAYGGTTAYTRFDLTAAGVEITEGSHTATLYVFDANHKMIYYTETATGNFTPKA